MQEVYPYIHSKNTGDWLYFFGELEKNRLFYDYSNERWIVADEQASNEREDAK